MVGNIALSVVGKTEFAACDFPAVCRFFYFPLLSKGERIEARTSPLLGLRRTTIFELRFQRGGFPCMTLKIFMDLSY